MNHRFHGTLTAMTLGLWGIGWLVAVFRQRRRSLRCRCCLHRLRLDGEIYGASYPTYAAIGDSKKSER